MSGDFYHAALVANWLDKADSAPASAQRELNHGELSFTINRLYYACFYAFTAVLTSDSKKIGQKHTSVRATLHRDYIHAGLMPKEFGRLYDKSFLDRQQGDYEPSPAFGKMDVSSQLNEVGKFVAWCRNYVRQTGVDGQGSRRE